MWDAILENLFKGLAIENESRAGEDLEPLTMAQYIRVI
jgi:hypothetical protein